jgi:uncharacterized integral membrane protein
LTPNAPSSGSTLRKIVAAIVLVPLAIVIIAFAVANRQDVTISLDPFNSNIPAASVTQPLFVVIIGVLIFGVVVGGVAAWLRQTKWRRASRRLERQVAELRAELDALKRATSVSPDSPPAGAPTQRLQLRSPLR